MPLEGHKKKLGWFVGRVADLYEEVIRLRVEMDRCRTRVTYWRQKAKAAQQEAGPRSKRHPKSVEGLGVKGEGEQ